MRINFKNKKKKDNKQGGVGFFHSIRFTITLLVMISVCLTTVLDILIVVPATREQLKKSAQSNMLGLAGAYGKIVQNAFDNGETANTNLYKAYKGLVGNCKVEGVESSYVYMVSGDGTMQYHPTEDKVGKPVENTVIKGVIEEIKKGNRPDDAAVSYEFKGEMKYASYHVFRNNTILVVSADESEILAPMNAIEKRAIAGSVLVFICMCIFAFIVAIYISRPILRMSDVIERVANFNFAESASLAGMLKRKDETGVMGQSVRHMCQNMRDMVRRMEETSENINQQASELTNISQAINTNCTDNSATTEQLAAGMQETSAATQNITANIDSMKGGVEEICVLTAKGDQLSQEITSRAEDMRQRTRQASEHTLNIYQSMKDSTQEALQQAQAVDKIHTLTNSIMEIASQTNLLALNASIEAARAGEAGKGFAVVASEIGNLANESSDAVVSINAIMAEISQAVQNMTDNLSDTVDFLENVVLKDYEQFEAVGVQYHKDADTVSNSMGTIEGAVDHLSVTIGEIVDALEGITSTVSQSATGVGEIAEKTTNIVSDTMQNMNLVDSCREAIDQLQDIIDQFEL